jgi:general secretion pathway protein N
MVKWRNIVGLALLSGGLLLAGMPPAPFAATSSAPDLLSNGRAQDADIVDLGSVKPIARPNRDASKPPSGNPLWSIPLSTLSATQERPIFSASRRLPPRAVAAPHVEQVNAPPPVVAAPDPPPLVLIGAVVGDSDAIAVFIDRTNQKMVRLRQGETHAGWVLSSVLRREVTLKKDDRTETIELKSTNVPVVAGAPGAPSLAGAPSAPTLPMPTAIGAGVMDTNYAPFTPRSTPKNGESDGL